MSRRRRKKKKGALAETRIPVPERVEASEESGAEVQPEKEQARSYSAMRVFSWVAVVVAIVAAWWLSAHMRSEWCRVNAQTEQLQWEGKLLPTTHDSYFFASAIKHGPNLERGEIPMHPQVEDYGTLTIFGRWGADLFGVSTDEVVTYMPVIFGGLIAIPVVLIGREYGSITWGFGAACMAGMGYSYFNRTIAGYFDTDLFSVFLPALALYCLLAAHRRQCRGFLLAGTLALFGFLFTYPSGGPISIALGLGFVGFRAVWSTWHHNSPNREKPSPDWAFTAECALLISVGLFCCNYTNPNLVAFNPVPAIVSLFVILTIFGVVTWFRETLYQEQQQILFGASSVALTIMLLFGGPLQQVWAKTLQYLPTTSASAATKPAKPTPQYMNVIKTVVEAKKLPFFPHIDEAAAPDGKLSSSNTLLGYQHGHTVAERVSGSTLGFILAIAGYILLVIIYPEFIIALPFIGIGIFSHWGGHRFTVHMVPIAAIGLVFLPLGIAELTRRYFAMAKAPVPESISLQTSTLPALREKGQWLTGLISARVGVLLLAALFIMPNINLALERSKSLQTVLEKDEIELIDTIRQQSKPGDYVHTWWDWGTAVWYHAKRNVLTHPGNQSSDTYVCAKMLMTPSPKLAAHLARTSVEYYHHGDPDGTGHLAVKSLFNLEQATAEESLKELEAHLPVKPTRDVFLFYPYRLISFYQVLHQFSERNLATGEIRPMPQFVRLNSWQRKGNGNAIFMGTGRGGKSMYFVDLPQLTLTDLRRGIPPQQYNQIARANKNPFPNSALVSFHATTQQWLHGKPTQLTSDGFVIKLMNGKNVSIRFNQIQRVYPTHLIKQVDLPNRQETHTVKGAKAKQPGLHVICSQNPPLALIVDDTAYQSQLVQMLVLNKTNPEYFEKVSENATGRVYKLKK